MVSGGFYKKMKILPLLLTIPATMVASVTHASGVNTLTVSATVLSKNNCRFTTANPKLNFGALDPGSSSDVTQTASVQFVCNGSARIAAFAFSTDNGLYSTAPGAYRMRHATDITAYLPYALSLSPATGTVSKGVNQNLTITGTVSAPDYQPALAGDYADTVVINLNP
jgi:hypothetical protein